MDMDVEKYAPYVAYARQRAAERRRLTAVRHQQAWETAHQIAAFLRANYQPNRIIAFGSLVHPHAFGLHSDLDIAVEGIPWLDYLHACNEVEAMFPLFKIDLIDIELVSDLLRQRIEIEGKGL